MDFNSIGVYRIVSPNGSCYIGMTAKSFTERRRQHIADFRGGRTKCRGLKSAFEKYGVEAMSFEILEDMAGYGDSEILHRERIWWLRHKSWSVNLYNGEPTGRGAVRHTKETVESIRILADSRADSNPILRRNQPCRICGNKLGKESLRNIYCLNCRGKSRRARMRDEIDLVKKMYLEDKLTTREIGEIFGISQQSAYRILQDMKLLVPKHRDYAGPPMAN